MRVSYDSAKVLATTRRLGSDTKIHGSYKLPKGYEFVIVPSNATVQETLEPPVGATVEQKSPCSETVGLACTTDECIPVQTITLASSSNWTSAVIALFQIIFAAIALHHTQGAQVHKYGYAAFGFTVVPFLLMSVLNLVASLLTPDYAAVYMVKSPEMEEAIGRGGYFQGTVGEVFEDRQCQLPFLFVRGKITRSEHSCLQFSYTHNGKDYELTCVDACLNKL